MTVNIIERIIDRKSDVIYKWRVEAMLTYIKHMVTIGDAREDIVRVIDNYLKFTDEVGK